MAEKFPVKGVTKFNGTDFSIWKFEMLQLLMAHGLEDLIEDIRERPEGERANATVKTWVKDNAKAMSLISSSMERKQLQGLITCTTAREMWQTLKGIYEQKSASSKLLLMQRYHEYRMSPSDSVVQHVTRVQNLVGQIRDVGQQIDETDVMAKILGSLPSKYSTLVTAWDSVPVNKQRVGILLERLIKEESKLTAEDESSQCFVSRKWKSAKRKQQQSQGQ